MRPRLSLTRFTWLVLRFVIVIGYLQANVYWEASSTLRADEPQTNQSEQSTKNVSASDAKLSDSERQLEKRFKKQIHPLLNHYEKGCVQCHSTEGTSSLVLSGNPQSDFRVLLDEQYLRNKGADTLLNRLTTAHVEKRMPKDAPTWSDDEIQKLKKFLRSVERAETQAGQAADERFPRALLEPYTGPQNESNDNQFITYRQLKGKIQVQFEDDWVRRGKDGFAENVAMFGGADFKSRFNESTQPSASFLTTLETMAREVSMRAYDERVGPFRDWTKPERTPGAIAPDDAHRRAIDQLYRRILFRPATEAEISQSYALVQDVYELESVIALRSDELQFELTVTDPESQLKQSQTIRIPVTADLLQVKQYLVDQTGGSDGPPLDAGSAGTPGAEPTEEKNQKSKDDSRKSSLSRRVLADKVWLAPDQAGQRLIVHNLGTWRNVSFAGLELYRVDNHELAATIDADAPVVEADGAWQIADDDGFSSFEDRNQHKGQSQLRVPLQVKEAGEYQVVLRWRVDERNAQNVLVELFAPRAGDELVTPAVPSIPAKGQAQFNFDCSEDAKAFFTPPAQFRFDQNSRIRISNEGTLDQVTAGAIRFIETDDPSKEFLIDSLDADEEKKWSRFDEGRFKAYNVKGAKLHDDNKRKGELELNYRVAKKIDAGWIPEKHYSMEIYYPGKRDQEPLVPVTIYAAASSPIIQVTYPRLAKADAHVRVDASSSYTVAHSKLEYHWRQTGGTRVGLADPTSKVLEFVAPRRSVDQAAWVALSSALVRHPDFLFTRPPSVFECKEAAVKRQLQLVKLALDLVGRSPTNEELQLLACGSSLPEMADRYLASEEFRQFYFHRVRLYLESQGTDLQDEPARLWCHVAFHGRPFQEILTADYTADAQFERQSRPEYHGQTGVLTTKGFIQGKPGLPHYNYAAQVSMLFLGFVYEVPPEIVELREGVTALGTTDPNSVCYSCHKILTPLAFQRANWTDEGEYRIKDEYEMAIDASDRGASIDYPFAGVGLEAFATQAVKKERFIRTMINTHVNFYFARPLRHREDERTLYLRLWERTHASDFKILELIRAIVTSPEYLEG